MQDINGAKVIKDGLGHMMDKPLTNGRKYVDSGFVHDIMDMVNSKRYFVRAHVLPSMRTELPHKVIIVISVNSGAVLHAPCKPCRASSLGCCSHVVAVLFSVLDYVKKHGPMLAKPCTSEECTWNKDKEGNKNPRRISEAKYSSRKKQATLPVIDFDPTLTPVKYREVTAIHVNGFLLALSGENEGISMWGNTAPVHLQGLQSGMLENLSALHENLKPEALMDIPGT